MVDDLERTRLCWHLVSQSLRHHAKPGCGNVAGLFVSLLIA